jgi:NDP-sugar pyrophosphorylase family protein
VKAIVLAAGLGTRLAPLTATVPKPLLPVLNRPVMSHVLDGLRRANITSIGVTINPDSGPIIRRHFGTGAAHGVNLSWLEEPHVLGTGGSLARHADFFEHHPVLVVTADMLSDLDLTALISHHHTHPATVTVAAHPIDLTTWPGDIIHPDGPQGLAYQYKPKADQALATLGSAGVWVVDPAILDAPSHTQFLDFSADVLPQLPTPRHPLGVYQAGPIHLRDFGQFDTYHQGNLEALTGCYSLQPAGDRHGPHTWIESGARIHPSATLIGPLAIGAQTTIDAHAHIIGPTVIGPGTRIGHHATVIRSVILLGATLVPRTLTANAVAGEPDCILDHLSSHAATPHAYDTVQQSA